MPIPKIPNGLKLTLILPEDMVLRVKTEAVQKRTQPSVIVQRALSGYWGDTPMPIQAPASGIPMSGESLGMRLTTRQQQAIRGRNLYTLLQDVIAKGLVDEANFLNALKVSPSAYLRYWKSGAKVPVNQLRRVHGFLDNYPALDDRLAAAIAVPECI